MPHTKSPLRYPGGKTQLYRFVKSIMDLNNINGTYIEAYSGGFGIGVELLLNEDVERVVINDYDKSIYSVWYSILHHTDALISLIEQTPITIEEWRRQKDININYKNYRNSLENGFSTLFLNRTNRSGIINAGPIGGYQQNSNYKLDCRFNKTGLIKKIRMIADKKDRIDLFQLDAVQLIDRIPERYDCETSFIFFDPPYYIQGKNLYTNFYTHKDHEKLAIKISNLEQYYWITTYDYTPQIQDIYNQFDNKACTYELLYSAQNKRKATEFLFASEKTNLISADKVKLSPI
ncbi:DNA adenine methylase [Enterococcus faecalis]|nr:DNA adenine methylase [Enterococcus faecalis]EGO8793108.1 DNA adenine methylase [Enterococcus faecalis]EHZ5158471.1 DNA adenine methylase [Enterococcus faecalis]EIR3945728.1 DNA adenine methylase [Enterococcus faecalis]EJR1552784.1 DNA adenine methylase [Enterococcus faecalis]EKR9336257.1 DNA adenine methylase [Enterococcus faecalis]